MSKWQTTHCPMCERPYAHDPQYEEYERLEKLAERKPPSQTDTDALEKYGNQFCWGEALFDGCTEVSIEPLEKLIALMDERDALRAEVATLKGNQ